MRKVEIKPREPFAADQTALVSTNAYAQAQAQSVLLLADAKRLLERTDLSYAMGLTHEFERDGDRQAGAGDAPA